MCGIVGAFGPSIPNGWIDSCLLDIAHRGPDSIGKISLDNTLTMAAVRLAMTDPYPRSNQPMQDVETGDILTFNGEIYNYKYLRQILVSSGLNFSTESDTEVLLYWIREFGSTRINELQGMFAFAYYSESKKTLLLARDLLGKKPLYLKIDSNHQNLAWSSSAKSLSKLEAQPEISRAGLRDYLALGYILDPNSAFQGVVAIKPGEMVELKLTDLGNVSRKMITPTTFPKQTSLRKLISDAVMRRIDGHEKVALSLSGGVDSAIIALILAENHVAAKCFSATWADSDKERYSQDARLAKIIAGNLNLDFQAVEMISVHELESEIKLFLKAMEEPNNNPSGVSMMKLYSAISEQEYRLVLTGDGADELFAGYERHKKSKLIPNLMRFNSEKIGKFVLKDHSNLISKFSSFIGSQLRENSFESWLLWHKLFSEKDVCEMTRTSTLSVGKEIMDLSDISPHASSTESLVQRDREIWLPMESNRKLDRISMHYSIEARSPFQDDEVVALGIELMSNNEYKNLDKRILKDCFPELEQLGVRPDKAGFVSPLGHWLRGNPILVSKSLECLVQNKFLDSTQTKFWIRVPNTGNFDLLKKLWALVILGTWIAGIKDEAKVVINE